LKKAIILAHGYMIKIYIKRAPQGMKEEQKVGLIACEDLGENVDIKREMQVKKKRIRQNVLERVNK
jgi:hypothetical protein